MMMVPCRVKSNDKLLKNRVRYALRKNLLHPPVIKVKSLHLKMEM